MPSSVPDTPAKKPASANVKSTIKPELIPIRREALGLIATARIARPIFVRLINSMSTTSMAIETASTTKSIVANDAPSRRTEATSNMPGKP